MTAVILKGERGCMPYGAGKVMVERKRGRCAGVEEAWRHSQVISIPMFEVVQDRLDLGDLLVEPVASGRHGFGNRRGNARRHWKHHGWRLSMSGGGMWER